MGKRARRYLIEAGSLDWSAINPDIFGSMFQAVIDPEQRGSLGQHYTSVSNIMKVIRPLFLDKLEDELERSRGSRKRLQALLTRLQHIKVFDPACGSGNFLIIAYKELRRIEMAVFEAMEALSAKQQEPLVPDNQSEMFDRPGQQPLMTQGGQREIFMSGIELSQFYGIEIDDFAHETAMLALWLAEHQMNLAFKDRFGYAEPSLPLRSSGNILHGNALRLDWAEVCPREEGDEVYICGNPPFGGEEVRTQEQASDFHFVFSGEQRTGRIDFVACWFLLGAKHIAEHGGDIAFVSTNSICQGIQVERLWPRIFSTGVHISFAYQTFPWRNSARDNAGVHVAVIGLTTQQGKRTLFELSEKHWHQKSVDSISPYLVEGDEYVVMSRRTPFLGGKPMVFGNKPTDGGHLILTPEEKDDLLRQEPGASAWLRRYIGSDEFIKGHERWCLWLVGASQDEIDALPLVRKRVEEVRKSRLASKAQSTRDRLAKTPHLFAQRPHPEGSRYILVPSVTSERREYAPVGFFDSGTVANNLAYMVPDGGLYEFAILSSAMHMDWMRLTAGRLKSDYRYSNTLVYNTFPWPSTAAAKREEIGQLGWEIILLREEFFDWTMAELYDPDTMPDKLREAHAKLDRAVEKLYRDKPFRDMAERQEYLLARYQELVRAEQAEQQAIRASQGA